MFAILVWDRYYPEGGLDQLKSRHSTEREALEEAKKLVDEALFDYVEVIDSSFRSVYRANTWS